jgi:hypothetical protein
MHFLHQCSVLYGNCNFPVYQQLGLTHCLINFSFSTFSYLLLPPQIFFVTHFIFFCYTLNSIRHPVPLMKLRMSIELRLSPSPFLKFSRVCPCECGCIHEDPPPPFFFSYPACWIQLFNGWSTCGCLAVFPGP